MFIPDSFAPDPHNQLPFIFIVVSIQFCTNVRDNKAEEK